MVKRFRYSVKSEVFIRGLKFIPGQPLISEIRLPFSPEEEAQLNIEENENGFDPSQIEIEGTEDAKSEAIVSEQVKNEQPAIVEVDSNPSESTEAVADEPSTQTVSEETTEEAKETTEEAVAPAKKTVKKSTK